MRRWLRERHGIAVDLSRDLCVVSTATAVYQGHEFVIDGTVFGEILQKLTHTVTDKVRFPSCPALFSVPSISLSFLRFASASHPFLRPQPSPASGRGPLGFG
jgi:hypothetical protein